MSNAVSLIQHLLKARHSIDTIESITTNLSLSKNAILQVIEDERYKDFFQRLTPAQNHPQADEKLVLTLDLFCCTHYPQECRNLSCPFLHLCQYSFRPMYSKCTNKQCQKEHDVLNSEHNHQIIKTRNLLFIPKNTLHDIIRASADPQRSLWACPDHVKKEGCSLKKRCDKLHYCYYFLVDACTKYRCLHSINDDCRSFFARREILQQNTDDILAAFKKVLGQRKSDYLLSLSAASAATRLETIELTNWPSARSENYSSRLEVPASATAEIQRTTNRMFSTESEISTPAEFRDADIFLLNHVNQNEQYAEEQFLCETFNFPIKLVISKVIQSNANQIFSNSKVSRPQYFYFPVPKNGNIPRILRLQIEATKLRIPLKIYRNISDAHDKCDQQDVSHEFCMLRLKVLDSGLEASAASKTEVMVMPEPSKFFFDRLWVYAYDL